MTASRRKKTYSQTYDDYCYALNKASVEVQANVAECREKEKKKLRKENLKCKKSKSISQALSFLSVDYQFIYKYERPETVEILGLSLLYH